MWVCRCVFFFKQKTAYEMRISDWSSDVCSSDLVEGRAAGQRFADDRQFEHRLAARIAADEAEQAAVGAGEVGIDGDRQHRLDLALHRQIGRASCRERGCQYV